jgi:DNA-binding IclR family transcriptional regulator
MEWVNRFVHIMDVISDAKAEGVSMTEISNATGLTKGTLHRMLNDFADQRLITQIPKTKKYRLGSRAMIWGGNFVVGQDPSGMLSEYCISLAERTDLYTFLSRFETEKVYCIYSCKPSSRSLRYFAHVGQEMPLHCTAAAKAILAFKPKDELEYLLSSAQINKYTKNTKIEKKEIMEELHLVKETHLAYCKGELEAGVTTISTPIITPNNQVVFSLSIVGGAEEFKNREKILTDELLKVGREASEYLSRTYLFSSVTCKKK